LLIYGLFLALVGGGLLAVAWWQGVFNNV
jgi:hypothetical protein